jgi:hypothetical protein
VISKRQSGKRMVVQVDGKLHRKARNTPSRIRLSLDEPNKILSLGSGSDRGDVGEQNERPGRDRGGLWPFID